MTNPDDDLSYYETELPKVIAGVRRGEKWEIMWMEVPPEERKWTIPMEDTLEFLYDQIESGQYRVRLAPVPVVKPWDSVEDFPLNAHWLRERDTGNIYRIDGCTEKGVVYSSIGYWPEMMKWDELGLYDWAPLGINSRWSPCVKPEGGK